MKVSLFDNALPSPDYEEGKKFLKSFTVPEKGHPNGYSITYFRTHLLFGRLILEKCQETADAIVEKSYKKFDALVMNHGCQITALQNHRLLKSRKLAEEARKVSEAATKQLSRLDEFLKNSASKDAVYAEKRKLGMDISGYLKACQCDVELSPAMAQLVRFRLLHSINGLDQDEDCDLSFKDQRKKQCEIPFTSFAPLEGRVTRICAENAFTRPKPPVNLKSWIRCLQIEEANEAVRYIKGVADECPEMLKERLYASLAEIREGTYGERLPQLYTGEVSLKGVDGIVLIKNKLKIGGVLREGTEDIRLFVKMPEGKVLSNDEVAAIPDDEPVVVLEGYVIVDEEALRTRVAELGVSTLLKATLARCDVAPDEAYTSDTGISSATEEGLRKFAANHGEFDYDAIAAALRVVKFDHMYCNSMKEERPDSAFETREPESGPKWLEPAFDPYPCGGTLELAKFAEGTTR